MVLAVPQLHGATRFGAVVAVRRGSIKPRALHRDFIDFRCGLPQVGFEGVPVRVVESAQYDTQAVIGEFHRPQGLPQKRFECMLMALSPRLHTGLAVIRFGENESEPTASA